MISENYCIFIVFNYKELQIIIAMLAADKDTKLFCMANDFCKFFDWMMAKYTLKSGNKRPYHRDSTMSKAEIVLIMILFHDSGYRCLKHFYLEKVCKHLRGLFPKVVSYNRLLNWKEMLLSLLPCLSRKFCWASVPESVLLTVPLCVYAVIRGYISTRHSKA